MVQKLISSPADRRFPRRRRGSVLVLVVATLGLLAVIGTVYVVSARSSRGSATAAQTNANFVLAQDAIHRIVGQAMSRTIMDARGNPGGYYHKDAGGNMGFQVARRYTMPEVGTPVPDPSNSFVVEKAGDATDPFFIPNEAWLCSTTYRPAVGAITDPHFSEFSILGPFVKNIPGQLSNQAFSPFTGTYNIPYYMKSVYTTDHQFKVVADPLPTVMTMDFAEPGGVAVAGWDAPVQMLPYSDASGIRYRYGLRIIDTSRMANINTGLALDGTTSPDKFGEFSNSVVLGFLRDTNDAMAALDDPRLGRGSTVNGKIYTAAETQTPTTTYIPFDLGDELELRSYGALGTNLVPRIGYESVNPVGKVWPKTFQTVDSTTGVRRSREYFTGFSASQDLRLWPSYTDTLPQAAAPAISRFVVATDTANNNDRTQAAQQVLDDLVPAGSTSLVPGDVYPMLPTKVDLRTAMTDDKAGANLAINATNLATAMRFAGFAGNTADNPGFTEFEVNSFFVNYVTYRLNNWHKRKVGTLDVWSMITLDPGNPANAYGGPSYIDNRGFVIKPSAHDPDGNVDVSKALPLNFAGTITTPDNQTLEVVKSRLNPTWRFVGHAAQPYINEVAMHSITRVDPATRESETPAPLDPVVAEVAIELANPYQHPLDLADYILEIETTGYTSPLTSIAYPAKVQKIDLAAYMNGFYVPARSGNANGHFVLSVRDATNERVLAKGGSLFAERINTASQHNEVDGLLDTSPSPRTFRLYRKYGDRTNKLQQAQIDGYITEQVKPYEPLVTGDEFTEEHVYYRRPNDRDGAATTGYWAVNIHTAEAAVPHRGDIAAATTGTGEEMTLGQVNPPSTTNAFILIPLEDRTIGGSNQGMGIVNPLELNKIVRLAHIIDATPDPVTNEPVGKSILALGAMPSLMLTRITDASDPAKHPMEAATEFPWDAVLHFDFRTPPYAYSVAAPTGGTPPHTAPPYSFLPSDRHPTGAPPDYKPGDYRANYLLENITFTSSSSIAGQINVNTAPYEVLCAIAPFGVGADLRNAKWACAVLAYRYRSKSDGSDPRIPKSDGLPINGPIYDFSDLTKYPGYGIRSLGELQVALTAQHLGTKSSLAERDEVWSAVYNTCTVRSDTFVVYGYLEAVRQNPRYNGAAGTFDNAEDWYRTGVLATTGTKSNTDITDDPNDATAKLLRVGRRRWVALMDRTPTLNGFGAPRVVAVKVLPN